MKVMANTEGLLCHDMCIRILATVCSSSPKGMGVDQAQSSNSYFSNLSICTYQRNHLGLEGIYT